MPLGDMVRVIPDFQPRIVASVLSETVDWGQTFSHIAEYQQKANTLGEGIKVAVLDTGMDLTHPDLAPNIKGSVDFVNDPLPPHGHGTHVAGIIGAANNGIGIKGVAPKCELYSVRVTDANGLTPGDLSIVGKGVEWSIANGMDVINISIGTTGDAHAFCYDKIVEAATKGIIIVASSGNGGSTSVMFPAAYEDVIAVAAIGKDGKLANFSNMGNEVDFVAPGVDVYSTWPGGQYSLESGTSMAAPFISGVIALLLAYHRQPGDHKTPINSYKDAIEHMRKLQAGAMVAMTPSGNGVGIVSFAGCDTADICQIGKPKIISNWDLKDRLSSSIATVRRWIFGG